jgi:hypothetical protein
MQRIPRRAILIAMALVLAVTVPAYLYFSSTSTEPDSFRGVKWGSAPQAAPGLSLTAEEGLWKFFERQDELKKEEGLPVEKVVYSFYKDRFYQGFVFFSSLEGYEKLKAAYTSRYGEPVSPEPESKKVFWNFDNVGILLTFDEAVASGRVAFSYKPIQLETEVSS